MRRNSNELLIGGQERNGDAYRWTRQQQQQQRNNHETRNLGIYGSACLDQQFCARAVERRRGRRKCCGWRGDERCSNRIFHHRNNIGQCGRFGHRQYCR
jgi:hypothetical protein